MAAWCHRRPGAGGRLALCRGTLVLLRSAVFVFFDAVFDSDQADRRIDGETPQRRAGALPVFTYGQDYQLAVEAWLAAPLFWLFGPSAPRTENSPCSSSTSPLAVLLIALLDRELGLRPVAGDYVVASLFILAPPGTDAPTSWRRAADRSQPLFGAHSSSG